MEAETYKKLLKKVNRQYIFYEGYRKAYSQLCKAVDATYSRGIPTSALLYGPSGSGKSTLLELFKAKQGDPTELVTEDGIYKIIPAFLVLVPASTTVKSFSITLLLALGCNDTRGDTAQLTNRLVQMLKTCRVKVVILDEFQRLTRRHADKTRENTLDWIVSLLNMIDIPLILSGTEECRPLIESHAPMARRFPYLAKLEHLQFSDDHQSDYMQLLAGLDEKLYSILPLGSGVHLTDEPIYVPLYAKTSGNLEYIRQIIHDALELCMQRASQSLTINDFYVSSEDLNSVGAATPNNPFKIGISECLRVIEEKSYEHFNIYPYSSD